MTTYCLSLLVIVLLAYAPTVAGYVSLSSHEFTLFTTDANIYHDMDEIGMQKILGLCSSKPPPQERIDSKSDNNGFKGNYLATVNLKKNSFLEVLKQIKN